MRPGAAAVLAAGALLAGACASAMTLTDDRGKRVSLERPAARIVSLAPHLAEVAFAAGAGSRLIGVSAYSDFPAAAAQLPVVSDSGRADMERIVALKPDLVLAWVSGNPAGHIERVERRGIAVLATEARRLDDIPRILRLVGAAAGTDAAAGEAAREYEQALRALDRGAAQSRRLRTFVEIWHRPLITVSGAHLISDVLRLCGASNVFEAAPVLTPAVSREALIAAAPEVLILNSGAGTEEEQAERWRRSAVIPAVRTGTLYALDPTLLQRQGPRIIDAARAVCGVIARARAALGNPG